MSRWSAADLARVASKQTATIATPRGRATRINKYGNEPTMCDGYYFDSKLEAKRYAELKLLFLAGAIHDLKFHQKWFLHVQGTRIGYYESDFSYLENGQPVIEDCKGFITPLYRWKKAHVHAEYGITIREIKA